MPSFPSIQLLRGLRLLIILSRSCIGSLFLSFGYIISVRKMPWVRPHSVWCLAPSRDQQWLLRPHCRDRGARLGKKLMSQMTLDHFLYLGLDLSVERDKGIKRSPRLCRLKHCPFLRCGYALSFSYLTLGCLLPFHIY